VDGVSALVDNILNPDNTFFIGDFHFDHTNVIKYCNRPFQSTEEMNKVMLDNYNRVVKDNSIVFFLGDMAFDRGSHPAKWWLSQLQGNIIFIKGSHDKGVRPTNTEDCYLSLVIDTDLGKTLLTHEPQEGKEYWQIHAHTHSTKMLDVELKRVCVSVEAINYTPVSLQQIYKSIKE
jgi:calcineurin-like phosphoesterase family protein